MEGEASDRAAVRLSPPARRRLVELGAETLGRLRPEEVPVALRAVARFTPKGRVQRGGVAIAAALDADDDFRAHVASAVEEALPVLAAAVRGGDTAACDPADVAATAFLLRPPQWLQTVADDVREWDRRQGAGKQVTAERDRMREEVTALTARLKAERASHRTAIAEAVAAVEADLARVRRELRARTEQARDADRARDEAVAALAEERERAGRAAAAADVEARALRARVAELERAAGGERRSARHERNLDDARLAVLVDTLTQAAAGVRAELALPATHLRPADAVAGGLTSAAPGAGRAIDDAIALEQVLRAPGTHLIVDGYNVSKSGYPDLDLAGQRRRLVAALAALAARTRAEVTVAFDGVVAAAPRGAGGRPPRGVRVRFSAGEPADDLIRRLFAAEPAGRVVVVVTSDAAIVSDVRAAGRVSAPAAILLAVLG